MSLIEIVVATGIASVITLAVLFLFAHSQSAYRWEEKRSDEFRSLSRAMQIVTDELSENSIYLLEKMDSKLLDSGDSEIVAEKFSDFYSSDEVLTFALENHQLIQRDYPSDIGFNLAHELKKPTRESVLANFINGVVFRLKPPHTLEITLEGKSASMQTEISNIKVSTEALP